jgi:hypothetical protein
MFMAMRHVWFSEKQAAYYREIQMNVRSIEINGKHVPYTEITREKMFSSDYDDVQYLGMGDHTTICSSVYVVGVI